MRLSAAVLATLIPAFVTSAALKPRQTADASCVGTYNGRFQLSIGTTTDTGSAMSMSDGQATVSQISDGQPQASQISDGQVQGPMASQISDGQVQSPPTVTQISDGQPQAPKVSQISDGQPQAPQVSQISDGQPQAPQVSQISDGQPQAGGSSSTSSSSGTSTSSAVGACVSGYLTLTLVNGTLKDQNGRFGYIAGGNNQFQFDNPVQAGGYGETDFSICANGTLAFRGSTDFWKCDSGAGFYNLYNAEISPDACQPAKFLAIACT